jgi:hypothetical protein
MFRSYDQANTSGTSPSPESRYFIPGTELKVTIQHGAAHTVIDGERWSCTESKFRDAV